jgi:hypothetical protein
LLARPSVLEGELNNNGQKKQAEKKYLIPWAEKDDELTLRNSFQSVASLVCPSHRCTCAIASVTAKGTQRESELHLRCIVTFLLGGTDLLSIVCWATRLKYTGRVLSRDHSIQIPDVQCFSELLRRICNIVKNCARSTSIMNHKMGGAEGMKLHEMDNGSFQLSAHPRKRPAAYPYQNLS